MTSMRLSGVLLWLTLLWIVLWGSLSVANLLSGIVVAVAVLVFARQPRFARRDASDAVLVGPIATIRFIAHVLFKLVQANLVIAWEVLTPRNRIHTGVVAVPMRTEASVVNIVVANVVTLTPGTLTIDVKGSPPVLYINVLHLHDEAAVRTEVRRLEELALRAFGTVTGRQTLQEEAVER